MKNNLRVRSLLAALALSLVFTTGAAAQTASFPVSANLEREAAAFCQISIFASGSFGVWRWDGSGYEYDSSNGTPESTVFINSNIESQPPAGCNITVAFDGLSNDNGGHIDVDNFEAYSYWLEDQDEDARVEAERWTHTRVTGVLGPFGDRAYDWEYTLEDVPNDLEVGIYSGDVTITFSNSQ